MIYSTADIAARCGIRVNTVHQLARKYQVGKRIGQRVLVFDDDDLAVFLARPLPGCKVPRSNS